MFVTNSLINLELIFSRESIEKSIIFDDWKYEKLLAHSKEILRKKEINNKIMFFNQFEIDFIKI